MPRIAILSDIHANLHALEATLRDVELAGVDEIVFGGDIVGYGAHPTECVRRVRELDATCVLGNHDYFVHALREQEDGLAASPNTALNPVWAGVLHAIRALDADDMAWLGRRPMRTPVPGGVLAHASLHDIEDWPYLECAETAMPTVRRLAGLKEPLGFFGHTHHHRLFYDARFKGRPMRTPRGRIYLPEDVCCAVTVGSVGQPRDEDSRAGYVLWDPKNRLLEERRLAYDAAGAAQAIVDAGLPESSASRLLEGRPNAFDESDEGPRVPGTFVHTGAEVGVRVD